MKIKNLEKIVLNSSKAVFHSVLYYTIGDIREEIKMLKNTGAYYYSNISEKVRKFFNNNMYKYVIF